MVFGPARYGDTMASLETKSVALNLSARGDKKKLEKLLASGWTIASQVKRSALQWGPLMTDIVLTREKP